MLKTTCPNLACDCLGQTDSGNIIRYGFVSLGHGRRRRYRCRACEKTFSPTRGTLNTSFIERLNLTVRQGSAYLCRRSRGHARSSEHLQNHLELLRDHYNFIRSHSALRFGRDVWTPAMQAGLFTRKLSFLEIFMGVGGLVLCVVIVIDFRACLDWFERRRLAA